MPSRLDALGIAPNINLHMSPLVRDALSGVFRPECDTERQGRSVGGLVLAATEGGERMLYGDPSKRLLQFDYAIPWAASIGIKASVWAERVNYSSSGYKLCGVSLYAEGPWYSRPQLQILNNRGDYAGVLELRSQGTPDKIIPNLRYRIPADAEPTFRQDYITNAAQRLLAAATPKKPAEPAEQPELTADIN